MVRTVAEQKLGQDSGRAKAGLAQLIRKSLDIRKDRVKTSSYRIQAQVLNFPTSRILWINTYFPTDPQTVAFDDSELLKVLGKVTKILKLTEYTDAVWNGDINWDPSRKSGFSKVMETFLEKTELKSVWDTYPVNFTHIHTDMRSTAVLDHFLVSAGLTP